MTDRLSKTEITKDALQEGVESVASTVGEVAAIITTAVKDVANAIGGLATDAFAIRDAAKQAAEKAEVEATLSQPAQD
ncbi:hypothetical protein ACXPWS_26095 [Mycobacterium sp. BMJ-28]